MVINCHGLPGQLFVGGEKNPPIALKDVGLFAQLRTKDIGPLWLVGCFVATGGNGQLFCSKLATTIGCLVVGADESQYVEGRYMRGNCPFGTIDEFEGTAYLFSPSGKKELYSIHGPDYEKN